jgi:hypothetical protein
MTTSPELVSFALANLVASAGVSAVVAMLLAGVLVWLTRTWIGDRLKASIQYEYDQKLAALTTQLKAESDSRTERLKSDLAREADKLNLAARSFGEVQKAAIAKRLAAIEHVWGHVLQLQDDIPAAMHHLDILLPEEYGEAAANERFGGMLASLDHERVIMPAAARGRKLAEQRPYIGEYVWALWKTYQAVTLRTVYLLDRSKMEPAKVFWFQDQPIRAYLRSALGDDALVEFDQLRVGKVQWVQDKFANVILSAMQRVIAGQEFGEAAMRQAQQMEMLLENEKRDAASAQAR